MYIQTPSDLGNHADSPVQFQSLQMLFVKSIYHIDMAFAEGSSRLQYIILSQ